MSNYFDDAELGDDPDFISKTQRKKEMHALQELGTKLLNLKADKLAKLELSAELRAAVEEGQRIHKHEARRRHLQYIGRLMRGVDIEQIRVEIERQEAGTQAYVQHFHQLEQWRDRLINEESALGEFVEAYPAADRQHLRQLVRNARREEEQNKPPASSRKLFKYVRELAE